MAVTILKVHVQRAAFFLEALRTRPLPGLSRLQVLPASLGQQVRRSLGTTWEVHDNSSILKLSA